MSVFIGLLISCLVLLKASHCATVIKSDSTKWKCQRIPYASEVHYGVGEGYQPYYIVNNDNLTLFSSTGVNCSLKFEPILDTLGRTFLTSEVYQMSQSLLYFVDNSCLSKKILTVDMSTCTTFDLMKKVNGKGKGQRWQWCENLIHFDDGFDEIYVNENNKRFRVSYDLQGNRIGEPRPFALDSKYAEFKPISKKSRASNLIAAVVGPGNGSLGKRLISVVSPDGELIKNLLEYPPSHASYFPDLRYIAESSYAYCNRKFGKDEGVGLGLGFECGLFDEFGREIFRNLTMCKHYYDSPVGLRNLKNGAGVVLFMFDYRNNPEVNVIEIRADGVVRKMSYPRLTGFFNVMYVADFDEANWQFTVRAGSSEKICWNTFPLPSDGAGDPEMEKKLDSEIIRRVVA